MAEVIVALDVPDRERALELVDRLGDQADFYKVGLELFSRWGPDAVRELRDRGKKVFLDLKLHDIPNTVAGAVAAAGELGATLLTVHAVGGTRMLQAARDAAAERGGPTLLAVTILTSMEPRELATTWSREIPSAQAEVLRLAELARGAGIPGVVASAREAAALRRRLGSGFLLVTPGIRLAGEDAHDQVRVSTPADAIRAGADHLVVGRSVTLAHDPHSALARVRNEMEAA